MCQLRMRTCGQRVVRAPHSHCEGTKFCDADCSGDDMITVCASDALFYKSECHMRKENCGYEEIGNGQPLVTNLMPR